MSDLVCDKLRRSEKENRWKMIDEFRRKADALGIGEEDVVRIVREERAKKHDESLRGQLQITPRAPA